MSKQRKLNNGLISHTHTSAVKSYFKIEGICKLILATAATAVAECQTLEQEEIGTNILCLLAQAEHKR